MKSIKPGRGPSSLGFVGSIAVTIFGVIWTIGATSMAAGTGGMGLIFPVFGLIFIGVGIFQIFYHYKNMTGKDRFSVYDITDSSEEGDPMDKFIHPDSEFRVDNKKSGDYEYCPYCGTSLNDDFEYCPKCGKKL